MIHQEAWYKEALDRSQRDPYKDRGIHEEYLREREILERDPTPDRKKLVDDAIRSWRMGRGSELEKRALEDHTLLDLLFMTARRAGYLPYLTMPEVFLRSRGLPGAFRGDVFDLAYNMVYRDPRVRKWFAQLIKEGMSHDFVEDSVELVRLAIKVSDQEPELLTSMFKMAREFQYYDLPYSVQEEVTKAALPLAEKHRDPDVLRWLWSLDDYLPDLSWEAVFATPDDALPDVGYTEFYNRLDPGEDAWELDEVNRGYVNLKDFIHIMTDWSDFYWETPSRRGGSVFGNLYLTTGEHLEEVEREEIEDNGPEDGDSDEDDHYLDPGETLFEGSETIFSFSGYSGRQNRFNPGTPQPLVEWLREHWPPPSTSKGEQG